MYYEIYPSLGGNIERVKSQYSIFVDEIKLLGVKITTDLKWNSNTKYITTKAYSRLWMIRRLKLLGASYSELFNCYTKHAISILEYCAVVWHGGLSQINSADIERVQKAACSIIRGQQYNSYKTALSTLGLDRVDERREALSSKFARKAFKSEKYAN